MSQEVQSDLTPLMKQYYELKAQAGDALLLFRMGDFYELFGEDAVTASQILSITLTSRDKNKAEPLPMAGVPFHSVQGYLQKLLKAGKKVAISEQFEETAGPKGKTIVRRAIVRVLTPAIQFEGESSEPAYLATAFQVEGKKSQAPWILACLDSSTGECRISDPLSEGALIDEVLSLPIRHWLTLGVSQAEAIADRLRESMKATLFEKLPENYITLQSAQSQLERQYGVSDLTAFVTTPASIQALGYLVTYLLKSQQKERLSHLRLPEPLRQSTAMRLGPRTLSHLDVFPDLFDLINQTSSALGARHLRRLMCEPLIDPEQIAARQLAIRELSDHPEASAKLRAALQSIYDLERISGRLTTGLAQPRDTLALGQSLQAFAHCIGQLEFVRSPLLTSLRNDAETCSRELLALQQQILSTQREDAPLVAREGRIFKTGFNSELDRLLKLNEDGSKFLIELEARERQATGIGSLKVRYNRVFGYFIEITSAHLKNVPSHYLRKQTTVGGERFFTEELKKFEDEIVSSSDRLKALEIELFEKLTESARNQVHWIMQSARHIAWLDALGSLADLSRKVGWTFPVIDSSRDLDILAGRHPVVDAASRGRFVPNDLKLSPETRLTLLITGPNMGGKSTVMRQVALIVLLGQIGAPVPARSARWGSFSSIYTRIGAHDAIARGQSTFMVEMSELAHILHHADERSLVVLDEIGRGTSTYDGMSVAWATLEWICRQTRARTLFATHYHELTRLEQKVPALGNAHLAVEGARTLGQNQLRFLYLLKDGPTNESFGIQVARMAGIPAPVVERAWQVLQELELQSPQHQSAESAQLSLFTSVVGPVTSETPASVLPDSFGLVKELENLTLESMTPLQALNALAKLQETARQSSVATS